jgi:predicted RNase H-like HicB family nuclease
MTEAKRFREIHPMANLGYNVLFEELAEGGYQVMVPALPGLITCGRTLAEAREMAPDAITCHVRGLIKDGEEIPVDPFSPNPPVREEVLVTV